MDIKNLAKIIYKNRQDTDYKTDQGIRRILAKNGQEIAKKTFERHIKEIKAEISNLHDIDFNNQTKAIKKKDLEKLFTQTEYVNGLKKIWEGEPIKGQKPKVKDILHAGKLISDFFGWNINLEKEDGTLPNGISRNGNTFFINIDFSNTI